MPAVAWRCAKRTAAEAYGAGVLWLRMGRVPTAARRIRRAVRLPAQRLAVHGFGMNVHPELSVCRSLTEHAGLGRAPSVCLLSTSAAWHQSCLLCAWPATSDQVCYEGSGFMGWGVGQGVCRLHRVQAERGAG